MLPYEDHLQASIYTEFHAVGSFAMKIGSPRSQTSYALACCSGQAKCTVRIRHAQYVCELLATFVEATDYLYLTAVTQLVRSGRAYNACSSGLATGHTSILLCCMDLVTPGHFAPPVLSNLYALSLCQSSLRDVCNERSRASHVSLMLVDRQVIAKICLHGLVIARCHI